MSEQEKSHYHPLSKVEGKAVVPWREGKRDWALIGGKSTKNERYAEEYAKKLDLLINIK